MAPILALSPDGIRATMTLNSPRRHNVITAADLEIFDSVLDAIAAAADVRVLVVTGAGTRTFSSGFDVRDIPRIDWRSNPLERVIDRVEDLAVPTVCALNGDVFGGATDLALACDFRIGVAGMRLAVPAAMLGVHYYLSGLRRFVERLGPDTAKRLLLAGEELGGEELMAVGYLDRLVAPADLGGAVEVLAAQLAAAAPLAVRGMKRAINGIARGALDRAAAEQALLACSESADVAEGAAAFAEKRLPRFSGR